MTILYFTSISRPFNEEKTSIQQKVLGKMNIHLWKTEGGLLSYSMFKFYTKWTEDLNIRTKPIKLVEENRAKVSGHSIWP